MSLSSRFGCFLLILGGAVVLLFGLPMLSAFLQNPQTVPLEWFAVFAVSGSVVWLGWKLFRHGHRSAASARPPSLAERMWSKCNEEEEDKS